MAIKPVVRYMILCDDYAIDPGRGRRITIVGLIGAIRSLTDPPYPLVREELCVFLTLTDGYGRGLGRIVCVDEETGRAVFETPAQAISFGPDPLKVVAAPFRIRDCPFPHPGPYLVQFWYDGELVEERPLLMR